LLVPGGLRRGRGAIGGLDGNVRRHPMPAAKDTTAVSSAGLAKSSFVSADDHVATLRACALGRKPLEASEETGSLTPSTAKSIRL